MTILKLAFIMLAGLIVHTAITGGLARKSRLPPCTMDGTAPQHSPRWGTAAAPFDASSPWNSRPVGPILTPLPRQSGRGVPKIEAGDWSTGVFVARTDDGPVTVRGPAGKPGVWLADSQLFADVTIARWPDSVAPAAHSDGHADLIDVAAKIIHSFWQLRKQDGRWVATQYAWTRLDGRGWGDPAHYFQGARAAGVPTLGGLIRAAEVDDGMPYYRHALAMSLERTSLAANPAYIFPATSADTGAEHINSGTVPMGALLMLPQSFPVDALAPGPLRKIARTLMRSGAYVVDRNDGASFVIYAEIGSTLRLHATGWDPSAAAALELISKHLQRVDGARGWIDGNGADIVITTPFNLLSMRGPWQGVAPVVVPAFDSYRQRLDLPAAREAIEVSKMLPTEVTNVAWAQPVGGRRYRLTSIATGGATIRLRWHAAAGGSIVLDTGTLHDGDVFDFTWPQAGAQATLFVRSGVGRRSSAAADLRALSATMLARHLTQPHLYPDRSPTHAHRLPD